MTGSSAETKDRLRHMPFEFQRICKIMIEVGLVNLIKVGVGRAELRTKP